MTQPDAQLASRIGKTAKVAIIAGGGHLPCAVAEELAKNGYLPFILIVTGESEPGSALTGYDHRFLDLEAYGRLSGILKSVGATHVVLAGTIARRPRLSAFHWNFGLLKILARLVAALARGDDGLLRAIVTHLEGEGFVVVGSHEILPSHLIEDGAISRVRPKPADQRDIAAAFAAARAIGALDIGQAAVAIGGRAIALEGVEGTDGLLERVRHLRTHGRVAGRKRGVLAKCAKPTQELRADLPAIGPETVSAAHAAGLAGIAVEAGKTFVLDFDETVRRADKTGLFIVGLGEGAE